MKKVVALTLSLFLVFTLISCNTKPADSSASQASVSSEEAQTGELAAVADGDYEGTGTGFGGELKLTVSVKSGAIDGVNITEHSETVGVSDLIIENMPKRIIDAQSYAVDAIAGATFTANAIKNATKEALTNAGATKGMFDAVPEVVKKDEEKTTDIVVVGAGLAGISAAIEAKSTGANVVVVEKLGRIGGNSIVSGGIVYATNSPINGEYDNDVEDMVQYYQMRANGKADEVLVRYAAENSGDTVAWMIENGVVFKDEVSPGGLSPAKRAHTAEEGAGVMMNTLYKNAVDAGVEFILETPATEIIMTDGVISGIIAEGRTGKITINSKAVIMAAGGFDGNEAARDQYAPHAKGAVLFSSYGNSGDYIKMGEAVGADMLFPDAVMGMRIINKNAYLTSGVNILAWMNTIAVTDEGVRFENESDDYPVNFANMVNTGRQDFYWIYDGVTAPELCEQAVAEGYGFKGETLEELAAASGMDSVKLAESVARYNSFAGGTDEDFGKEGIVALAETGPYYAIKVRPATIAGFGGFVINTDSEALDKDGKAIAGLYAAGECASGQFFDHQYAASGTMLNFSTVYGRTAGRNAVEFIKG